MNYQHILASIARDKGQEDLALHIESFTESRGPVISSGLPPEDRVVPEPYVSHTKKYNITKMPEATCDGCQ